MTALPAAQWNMKLLAGRLVDQVPIPFHVAGISSEQSVAPHRSSQLAASDRRVRTSRHRWNKGTANDVQSGYLPLACLARAWRDKEERVASRLNSVLVSAVGLRRTS